MFILKLRLTRDRVIIAVCLLLTALSLTLHFLSFGGFPQRAENSLERVDYLVALGYEVDPSSEKVKTILLPEKFDNIYDSYNQLQKAGGFDLREYRGRTAELYTYKLLRLYDLKEASVNLIVCKNIIIGGDVATLEKGGLCMPLIKAEENITELKEK